MSIKDIRKRIAKREAKEREWQKKVVKRYKKIVAIYKINGCSICGYNKCNQVLYFHHTDPREKDMRVSQLRTASVERIISEIKKCIVVCANCHAEIHAKSDDHDEAQ